MSPHWIGAAIALASLLLTGLAAAYRWILWARRWDVPRYSGILVRLEGVEETRELVAELRAAGLAIRRAASRSLPAIMPGVGPGFRVEVVREGDVRTPTVPRGVLPDGSSAGGSIRGERAFPWSREHWVAVVVEDRAGSFLIHEVIRHIFAIQLGRGVDFLHRDAQLAAVEAEAKEDFRERLRPR